MKWKRATPAAPDGFKFDWRGWYPLDVRVNEFFAAINAGDWPGLQRLMAMVIVRWPYRFDPRKTTQYERLTPEERLRCVQEVTDAFAAMHLRTTQAMQVVLRREQAQAEVQRD